MRRIFGQIQVSAPAKGQAEHELQHVLMSMMLRWLTSLPIVRRQVIPMTSAMTVYHQ